MSSKAGNVWQGQKERPEAKNAKEPPEPVMIGPVQMCGESSSGTRGRCSTPDDLRGPLLLLLKVERVTVLRSVVLVERSRHASRLSDMLQSIMRPKASLKTLEALKWP